MRRWIPALSAALALGLAAAAPPRVEPTRCTLQVAPADAPRTRLVLAGRVLGKDGRPLVGAALHVYRTDAVGRHTVLAGDADREQSLAEPGSLRDHDDAQGQVADRTSGGP